MKLPCNILFDLTTLIITFIQRPSSSSIWFSFGDKVNKYIVAPSHCPLLPLIAVGLTYGHPCFLQRCSLGGRFPERGGASRRKPRVPLHIHGQVRESNSGHRVGTQHADRGAVLQHYVRHHGRILDGVVLDGGLGPRQALARPPGKHLRVHGHRRCLRRHHVPGRRIHRHQPRGAFPHAR